MDIEKAKQLYLKKIHDDIQAKQEEARSKEKYIEIERKNREELICSNIKDKTKLTIFADKIYSEAVEEVLKNGCFSKRVRVRDDFDSLCKELDCLKLEIFTFIKKYFESKKIKVIFEFYFHGSDHYGDDSTYNVVTWDDWRASYFNISY
jgi:hypothetical protein